MHGDLEIPIGHCNWIYLEIGYISGSVINIWPPPLIDRWWWSTGQPTSDIWRRDRNYCSLRVLLFHLPMIPCLVSYSCSLIQARNSPVVVVVLAEGLPWTLRWRLKLKLPNSIVLWSTGRQCLRQCRNRLNRPSTCFLLVSFDSTSTINQSIN